MIKFFTITVLLFNVQLFAQTQVDVIESYLIDQKKDYILSKKVIPNNDFKKVLIEDYFKLTFEDEIIDKDLEAYQIVKNEFDLENLQLNKSMNHNFLLKNKEKGSEKIHFSNVLYSKNGNFAIFYFEERCKGLCGGGELILMELKYGEWQYVFTLYAWLG